MAFMGDITTKIFHYEYTEYDKISNLINNNSLARRLISLGITHEMLVTDNPEKLFTSKEVEVKLRDLGDNILKGLKEIV